MLSFEIHEDGGVTIVGSKEDLEDLGRWAWIASKQGEAIAAYVADAGMSRIHFRRNDMPD